MFAVQAQQRYTYRVLQTIKVKVILLCVLAERAALGSAKTALKFFEIQIQFNEWGMVYNLKSERNNP